MLLAAVGVLAGTTGMANTVGIPLGAAAACGCEVATDVTVTPKPVHFGAANTMMPIEINAVQPGKYVILEQTITEDLNSRFSFVGGASPCLNAKIAKPAAPGEPEKCKLEIKATGLVNGETALFVTKYERVPAVFQTTYYDNLEW